MIRGKVEEVQKKDGFVFAFRINEDNLEFDVKVLFPFLQMETEHKVTGHVLQSPVDTKGYSKANMSES